MYDQHIATLEPLIHVVSMFLIRLGDPEELWKRSELEPSYHHESQLDNFI